MAREPRAVAISTQGEIFARTPSDLSASCPRLSRASTSFVQQVRRGWPGRSPAMTNERSNSGGSRSGGRLWYPPPPTPSPIRSGGHDRPASGAATGRIPAPVAGRAHVRAARAASLSRSWGRFFPLLFLCRSYWGGSVLRVGSSSIGRLVHDANRGVHASASRLRSCRLRARSRRRLLPHRGGLCRSLDACPLDREHHARFRRAG